MRCASVIVFAATLLAPIVTADVHYSGLCTDKVGGQHVYNADATNKACEAYKNRNTGDKQWDQCPDCVVRTVGNLEHCHSEAQHIGGDELKHYCTQNGAGASLSD